MKRLAAMAGESNTKLLINGINKVIFSGKKIKKLTCRVLALLRLKKLQLCKFLNYQFDKTFVTEKLCKFCKFS